MMRAKARGIRSRRSGVAGISSPGSMPETDVVRPGPRRRPQSPSSRAAAKKGVHDVRCEPGPAAGAGDSLGAGGPAGGVEDFDGLGEAADAGEERYLLAAQPVRVAGAVPALVEGADGPGRPLREAQVA